MNFNEILIALTKLVSYELQIVQFAGGFASSKRTFLQKHVFLALKQTRDGLKRFQGVQYIYIYMIKSFENSTCEKVYLCNHPLIHC